MLTSYVINLDRSPDRLQHMRSEFARIGADFVRIPAVDGACLGEEEIARFIDGHAAAWDKQWFRGEVASFQSHRAAWRIIADGDAPAGAVFEDDVHVAGDLSPLLASSAWIPADADVVRLEANRDLRLRQGRRIPVAPGRRLYRVESGTWGAAGYIVSKRTAAWLCDIPSEERKAVDVLLFKPADSAVARRLARYQVVPAVCIQDQLLSPSDPRFPSIVGNIGRTPHMPRKRRFNLKRFLPWKKKPIPFRA